MDPRRLLDVPHRRPRAILLRRGARAVPDPAGGLAAGGRAGAGAGRPAARPCPGRAHADRGRHGSRSRTPTPSPPGWSSPSASWPSWSSGERLHLRLGAFPSALATLVPEAIARLQRGRARRPVHVEEGPTGSSPNGWPTVACTSASASRTWRCRPPTTPDCTRIELLDEPFLVAMAPGHRLARRDRVELQDLADDPWTAPSADHLVARTCRAAGFEPRFVSITRDPLAIRALVVRGLAVTLVPQLLASELGDLAVRPLAGTAPAAHRVRADPGGRPAGPGHRDDRGPLRSVLNPGPGPGRRRGLGHRTHRIRTAHTPRHVCRHRPGCAGP